MRDSPRLLDHACRNQHAKESILLIHGAVASGLDWDLVEPYLADYHLLVPSLFTQQSRELAQTVRNEPQIEDGEAHGLRKCYVNLLSDLIESQAKNGRAHIVGLSLGGSWAVSLAAARPDLTISLFASGIGPQIEPPHPILRYLAIFGMLVVQSLIECLPRKIVSRMLDREVDIHPGRWNGQGKRTDWELMSLLVNSVTDVQCRRTFNLTAMSTIPDNGRLRIPVCLVAATRKKWFMPTGDSIDTAIVILKQLCGSHGKTDNANHALTQIDACVLEAKSMFHAWNRQDAQKFAECIIANLQGFDQPPAYLEKVWSGVFVLDGS